MNEVELMVHMNGGVGDTSYAKNCLLQKKMISMTWPIMKEVIIDLWSDHFPATLVMADLGCSSGSNTLMVISNLIKEVEEIGQKIQKKPFEYQILLNDLPGNDFNALFRSLPCFLEKLKNQLGNGLGPCLFNGVPGSFYRRLFPSKTVHFLHSSSSLHWLSEVPKEMESNIFMGNTTPRCPFEAYYQQFQKDFSMFLKCRAEELVNGGRMVLTILGRTVEDRSNKECRYFLELLTLALNTMVSEGMVEKKKVESFNTPNYMPSLSEVEVEVSNEGSFTINRVYVSSVDWNFFKNEFNIDSADNIGRCIRAVFEPLLIRHFGETIMDELFVRYKELVADHLSKQKMEFFNLTIALTRK